MGSIKISVFYASETKQKLLELSVPERTTVKDAIKASNMESIFPEINLTEMAVGIFAKEVSFDSPLKEGDRVEIYRPLKLDPKDARRKRAEKT